MASIWATAAPYDERFPPPTAMDLAAIREVLGATATAARLAREAGFKDAQHVSGSSLARRYFANRDDDLRPSTGEDFVVATT